MTLVKLSLKFPAGVAENSSPNGELSGERCCAAFQTAAAHVLLSKGG